MADTAAQMSSLTHASVLAFSFGAWPLVLLPVLTNRDMQRRLLQRGYATATATAATVKTTAATETGVRRKFASKLRDSKEPTLLRECSFAGGILARLSAHSDTLRWRRRVWENDGAAADRQRRCRRRLDDRLHSKE